jgi:hypothetical protein
MDSDYHLMKFEYDLHKGIREKHNMVKFFQDGCVSVVGALEKANTKYDPFGLELNGWCDNVNNESERLYDTFGDLYEKWNKPGKSMPPELALIGILGFSAAKTHFVNSGTNSIPTIEEKQKQDPQYLEKIKQQAMGNTLNSDKQKNTFDDKISKQYQEAVKQVKDFQQIREYDEVKLRTQQKMMPPTIPESIKNSANTTLNMGLRQSPINNTLSPEQYAMIRDRDIEEQRVQFEKQKKQELEDPEHVSRADMESVKEKSNFDDILKHADERSNTAVKQMKNRKKSKNRAKSIKVNIE